ncbi:MAG: tRNA epoxyqueuosine(34) reductase QueG [Candidatus Acidiferrales bacterium]
MMKGMDCRERTRWVLEQAENQGFDLCGVAPAEAFPELGNLPEWLARGYGGEMKYLADARRNDPRLVLPGARRLIVVALNYNAARPLSTAQPGDAESPRGWVSRYAWGDDYHDIIGRKLEALITAMRAHLPEPFEARAYVDTGPINERVAAKYAGLGWLAKNTCLINQKLGSWLFLGVIITTLELAPSLGAGELPPPDLCGNCTRCLDACPTGAFAGPYVLDASRCISYLTIELRGSIPEEFRPALGNALIGCDICQDVCPWNRKSPLTRLAAFEPRQDIDLPPAANGLTNAREEIAAHAEPRDDSSRFSLFSPELEILASLTQQDFSRIFRGSAVKRAKWRGLVRNACVALGNSHLPRDSAAHARVCGLLARLSGSEDALIAEHARWALSRLDPPRGLAAPST